MNEQLIVDTAWVQAQIDAATADLRRQLAEAQRWQPVEDGEVPGAENCDQLAVGEAGRQLITWSHDTGYIAFLPDDVRLCRLVEVQPADPQQIRS